MKLHKTCYCVIRSVKKSSTVGLETYDKRADIKIFAASEKYELYVSEKAGNNTQHIYNIITILLRVRCNLLDGAITLTSCKLPVLPTFNSSFTASQV